MKNIINIQVAYASTRESLKHRDTKIILSASAARLFELFIVCKYRQLHSEYIIEDVWEKHGIVPSGYSLNRNFSILKAFTDLEADNLIEIQPRQKVLFHASIGDASPSSGEDEVVYSVSEIGKTILSVDKTKHFYLLLCGAI